MREKISLYRRADKSLARPTSRCILFGGDDITFDASLVIYINSANIPPIMIINRIYEHQNLVAVAFSFLIGLRTYQFCVTIRWWPHRLTEINRSMNIMIIWLYYSKRCYSTLVINYWIIIFFVAVLTDLFFANRLIGNLLTKLFITICLRKPLN